ncbi:MAG: hypothetical protein J2P49_10910, partial [Methylocapsa sp.]|nr:hypothetical protein [Methylocapsa sp.]
LRGSRRSWSSTTARGNPSTRYYFRALACASSRQRARPSVRKTVVFDRAGVFSFVCDLPGHWEAGMSGKLTVRGATAGASRAVVGLN